MPDFRVERENVWFWLTVKARARREALGHDSAGELRLEVQAPPAHGRANEACVRFFARQLRLPQACVVILSGKTSRRKLLRITGRTAAETIERLTQMLQGAKERP